MCQEREMLDPFTGENILRRTYVNDFTIGLEALTSDGIPTSLVVELIKWLRAQGLNISLVTTDKPGMNTIVPELKLAGFKTEYLSVDTSRAPYILFKQKVNQGEFIGVNNKLLIQEAYNLRDDGNKVDHPVKNPDGSKGSKDLADGTAGSFYSCFTNNKSLIGSKTELIDKLNARNKEKSASKQSKLDTLSRIF
jgi:phage terminase large subunit-like protein